MTLIRPPQEIPEDITHLLGERRLCQGYDARLAYQRNDYLAWIARAKRPVTRMKRISRTLSKLEAGSVYMKMRYASSER